jgi:hypothetical protein
MSPALFLQILTDVCAPIFAVVGCGWLLDRKFALNLESLVKINIYLLVPAFVFARLMDAPMSGREAGRIMLCAFSVIAPPREARRSPASYAPAWLRTWSRRWQAFHLAESGQRQGRSRPTSS